MTVLQYDLRPDLSSFTINVQSDPATGASLFEQTLNVVLQKHKEQDPEQLRLISRNRMQIFVLDNNDNLFLFGATHGMDLNGGTLTSGAARNEMSGQTLTFAGREADCWSRHREVSLRRNHYRRKYYHHNGLRTVICSCVWEGAAERWPFLICDIDDCRGQE